VDQSTCAVAGCERSDVVKKTGYCYTHNRRFKTKGDPGPARISPKVSGACAVAGCERTGNFGGLCQTHRYRMQSNGDPLVTRKPGSPAGPDHPLRAQEAGYTAVHHRLRRVKGPAAALSCVGCGLGAAEWALSKDATRVRRAPDNDLLVSDDPSDYQPMCVKCHRVYDLGCDELLEMLPR
jgi:hypothetical protein